MDPHELTCRFLESHKGNAEALGTNGQLLCMVIATWAASFGINEQGEPEHIAGPHIIRAQRDRSNMMVRELLQLIDLYGLLRRPSCESRVLICELTLTYLVGCAGDGVRVLLLVMPLTEGKFSLRIPYILKHLRFELDVQTPLERLTMYEAAINQVYTLCSLASVASVNSGQGEFVDAAVRARIFWYAYAHEGITTGLRGGRLLLYVFYVFVSFFQSLIII